jgi:hypothetical protein
MLKLGTSNFVRAGKWVDIQLEGNTLVVDGFDWALTEVRPGARSSSTSGPMIRVEKVSLEKITARVEEGSALRLPPALSAWSKGERQLLSGAEIEVLGDGAVSLAATRFTSGTSVEIAHKDDGERRWLSIPYATSFVEIPWKIELKKLPVVGPAAWSGKR